MRKHFVKLTFPAAALIAASLTPAYALPTLTLDDGVNPVITITDGGLGDANPIAGAVTFIGTLGVWTLNVSTGETKPAVGTAVLPELDLNTLDTSSAAGTLKITFSESGFGPTAGTLISTIGGTQGNGNVLFKTSQNSTILTTIGSLSGTPFSGSQSAALIGTSYSLTEEVDITHTAGGSTSFDANANAAPDSGMSLLLLGMGLAALGAFAISRKQVLA
jgi:hypothetical protein